MKPGANLRIDIDRLMGRIEALGRVGALSGGGVCRLALSDADRDGRNLVVSWTEHVVTGVSNHAGTTPLRLRHDAGYVAAALSVEARRLAEAMGGNQVATVGVTRLAPDLINGDLGVAARIAGHESTRTTQPCNRLHEEISLGEFERIHI